MLVFIAFCGFLYLGFFYNFYFYRFIMGFIVLVLYEVLVWCFILACRYWFLVYILESLRFGVRKKILVWERLDFGFDFI